MSAMAISLSPQTVKFEPIWLVLQDGISKIITLTGVKGMPMIEDVYKLCTAQPQPFSEELYLKLKDFLERHVDSLRESLLEHQSNIISDYLKKWKAYSTGTEFINAIFRYLNQNWIKKRLDDSRNKISGVYQGAAATTEVYAVGDLALVIWRDRLFNKTKDRLLRAVLEVITRDRDGELITQSEVKGVVDSYVKLGLVNKTKPMEIYKEDFETPFLAHTREYYARESTVFIAANGVATYMKKAEARIEEEAARGKRWLPDSTACDKLRKEIDSALIERHRDHLQHECENMFRDDKQADLSRMYHLMMRIDEGVKPMLEVLQTHVEHYGLDAIRSLKQDAAKAADPKTYVEVLLEVHLKFADVVKKAFSNDPAFVASLDKACRKVVNDNAMNDGGSKSPELLAKYCDVLLKKGKSTLEEKQLEEKLSQIITIFKYVDDKDVFQKFYSKMLARRLIQATSISSDMESYVIGGLKQACGYEYTSKLQRMFTDMALSNEINDKFKEYVQNKPVDLGKIDVTMLVLTAGSWPLHDQPSTFTLPRELEVCVTEFQTYYSSMHQGRKLHWLHHLAKGDMKTSCYKRPHEVQGTCYQMAVLLQFNAPSIDSLSFEDIARGCGLKDQDLKRTLASLLEFGLLKKKGAEKEKTVSLSESDSFVVNRAFTNKRLKLKITAAVTAETPVQHAQTMESIEEDRKLFLQAAIVRIMKARKTLTHAQLVQETIQQSKARFTPHIPMIKKCIEQLIEKEYLARVEGETNKYSYVA